jgi:hypothetical protein
MLEPDAQHPLRAMTRRDVVVGGAVLGATVAVGGRAMAASRDWPWTAGMVESAGPDGLVLRAADGSGPVRVRLAPGAAVVRDGPARLEDFVVGEEVAALGEHGQHGDFVATRLEPTYRLVEGDVSARDGDRLEAGDETLELSPRSHVNGDAPLDALGPGDHVLALGRRDPRTGAFDVAIITVTDG